MVEVARLESVYRFIAYPGFESPSLRQVHKSLNLDDFSNQTELVKVRFFVSGLNQG